MKALKRTTTEAIISHADSGELDKLTGEMAHMSEDALAELKALVWLGRDRDSPKHWDALVIEAKFQLDDQTARYLSTTPELADILTRALDQLEAAGRI